jgi:7-cyano-7-deazaguanine synthase in queuosine biosynthesis
MTLPAVPEELDLRELRVDVVEPQARGKRQWVRCEIGTDVQFKLEGLKSYCLAPWQPVVYDAFLIAAAVQFCDHVQRRPRRGWARAIALRVPVHEPGRWNDPAVTKALHDALNYLTGDRWTVSFKARRETIEPPLQQPLGLMTEAGAIIPYSEGMDSRAVAGLMAREYGDRLIRVRLGSGGTGNRVKAGAWPPFAAVPYKLPRKNRSFPETSARSRGFKFAVLSGMAAYLTGAPEIIVPESGQGALGPWLVPVGQAPADMRNHPFFMRKMETFLKALLGYQVRFRFPRLWYTKGETLAAFASGCPDGDSWADTWSCWQESRQVSVEGRKRQCGICAACMLRRLAVHAAGLHEHADMYVWEDLSVADWNAGAADSFGKVTDALYEYAVAGVLHLDHLADLNHSALSAQALNMKTAALARAMGLSKSEAEVRLRRLLEQHEKEWRSFVQALGEDSFVARWARRAG